MFKDRKESSKVTITELKKHIHTNWKTKDNVVEPPRCALIEAQIPDWMSWNLAGREKVSFSKESLAQSIIFNTTILVKWIKLCLNFHFPTALRSFDMFSVLIALFKVWTHNGWFYICTTHVRCTWIMWVGEAGGATKNYRGNTFSY